MLKGNGSGGASSFYGPTQIIPNTWYHVAFTIDNSSLKLYLNGVLEGSSSTSNAFNYMTGRKVYLGGSNDPIAYAPFTGSMDNVRFYNRVLTPTEVSQLYTQDPTCTISSAPVANFSITSNTLCAGTNFTVTDLSSNSPTGWSWQTPGASTASSTATNPVLNYASPGIYTISLVSSNTVGLSNTATQTIAVNANPVVSISSSSLVVCSGKTTTLTGSGAQTYTWSNGTNNSTALVNPTITSTYTLIGKNTQGCASSATLNQLVINNPNVTISSTSQTICANKNVTLTANGANTYSWSNAQLTPEIIVSPTITSNYVVTGTDNNGCSANSNFQLTITNPTVSISTSSLVNCAGKATTLTASGLSTYTWNTNQNGTQIIVSPNTTTMFVVNGLDVNGCSASNSITQIVLANPNVNLTISNTLICSGKTSTLLANGASNYTWSSNQNTQQIVVSPSSTTTYSVIGADNNGCSSTNSITLFVIISPSVNISSSSSSICIGQSATLTANSASNYTWNTNQSTSQIVVNPSTSTSYSVLGVDNNNCSNNSSINITVLNPSINISASSPTLCSGKQATLTATGVNTYTWSTNQTSSQITIVPLTSQTYSVVGKDNFGCSASASITPLLAQVPTLSITSSSSTVCSGKQVTLSASGANTYTWQTNQTASTISVSPLLTMSYSLVGINTSGCTNTANIAINVLQSPTVSITASSASICAGKSSSLTASGALTYSWSTNQTQNQIIVSPPSTSNYTLIGIDANGCSNSSSFSLSVSQNPTLSATPSNSVLCVGQIATITASGANSYTWSTNQITSQITFTPNTNNSFTLNGQNLNGCTSSIVITPSISNNPTISIVASSPSACAGNSFTLSASGGVTYSWSSGQNTSQVVLSSNTNSVFSLTGFDINGCSSTSSHSQTILPLPVVSINTTSLNVCAGQSVSLTAQGAATYSWSNNQTSSLVIITPSFNTTYTVTGTDSNNCVGVATLTQSVSALPNLIISSSSTNVCSGNSVLLTAVGASTYSWNTNQLGAQITVTPTLTTTYTVSGQNNLGCTNSSTFTQNVLPSPNVNIASTHTSVCEGKSATLTASGASNYTWSSGFGNSISIVVTPTVATVYTLTGTDLNGCSAISNVLIGIRNNPVLFALSSNNNPICIGETVTLTATGAITYSWSNGTTGAQVTDSPTITTTYTVLGEDIFGCSDETTVNVAVRYCGVGVSEISANNRSVFVYPNPSSSFIVVKSELTNRSKIELSNSLGQILYAGYIENEEMELNISNFPNGIYFITIHNIEQPKQLKFIKQ